MNMSDLAKEVAYWLPYAITAAAAAMAVLPQGPAGSWWDKVRTIVNWLAMNWGHAKNIKE